jgi:predicted oxidoreductase
MDALPILRAPRSLGRSPLTVFPIAFGCWRLVGSDVHAARARIESAIELGIIPGVPYDSSPAHLRRACDASLTRLGVERIDLYQLHRPDWLTHPEETAAALVLLRESGKIRQVGVSNFSTSQFDALQRFLPFPIATHQPELSCWHLDPLLDGVPRAAVAIAWLLAHPAGIVPIVGTQRPERLAECLRAFDVRFTRSDWYAIVAASRGEPLP